MGRPTTVTVPHNLGKIEARRRLVEGFGAIQSNMRLGLGSILAMQERWEGDTLHIEASGLRQKVSGQLEVLADSVQIHIETPDVLAMIASRLLAALKAGTQKLLE